MFTDIYIYIYQSKTTCESRTCELQCDYRMGTVMYDVNPTQIQSSGTDTIVYVVNQAQV